jgi:hypothetical protein
VQRKGRQPNRVLTGRNNGLVVKRAEAIVVAEEIGVRDWSVGSLKPGV